MVFTLYGYYVRHVGGKISIGALVRLLTPFGVSEQAIRSVVSRMKRNGQLQVEREGNNSCYSLTESSAQTVEQAAVRIFHAHSPRDHWDGNWRLVTYSIPEKERAARDRLRHELGWLGFGMFANGLWMSPHNYTREVEQLADALDMRSRIEVFTAHHNGFSDDQTIVQRCWNLSAINERYAAFIAKYQPMYEDHCRALGQHQDLEPSQYFVNRFTLIHEYRRFPFKDPELPQELLPADWRGIEAMNLFRQYHDLLAEKATAFFDKIYQNGK